MARIRRKEKMSREGYKKVFQNNPKLLQEMLDLRRQGWSFPKLGEKYGIDHSSVIWQVRKHGIKVKPGLLKYGQQRNRHVRYDYFSEPSEKTKPSLMISESDKMKGVVMINQGKSYSEYLKKYGIKLIDIGGWMVERKVKKQ